VARTLALKAQKSRNGRWCLETESFLHSRSCLIVVSTPSKPLGSKKRKIQESGPDETASEEPGPGATSILASTPLLPLEETPFDSSPHGYDNYLAELTPPEATRQSRTFAQNVATSGAWDLLLPRLVYPLMEQERGRRNLSPSEPPTTTQCLCLQRDAKVLVVSFTSMLPSVV